MGIGLSVRQWLGSHCLFLLPFVIFGGRWCIIVRVFSHSIEMSVKSCYVVCTHICNWIRDRIHANVDVYYSYIVYSMFAYCHSSKLLCPTWIDYQRSSCIWNDQRRPYNFWVESVQTRKKKLNETRKKVPQKVSILSNSAVPSSFNNESRKIFARCAFWLPPKLSYF